MWHATESAREWVYTSRAPSFAGSCARGKHYWSACGTSQGRQDKGCPSQSLENLDSPFRRLPLRHKMLHLCASGACRLFSCRFRQAMESLHPAMKLSDVWHSMSCLAYFDRYTLHICEKAVRLVTNCHFLFSKPATAHACVGGKRPMRQHGHPTHQCVSPHNWALGTAGVGSRANWCLQGLEPVTLN